jgi:hypothetical protein
MANGSSSLRRTRAPSGENISTSSTVRPAASSRCGQAFSAFDVTPPPHAFGSFGPRASNNATRAPLRANRSAANDPAGPAPMISRSNSSRSDTPVILHHRARLFMRRAPCPRARALC